MTTGSRRLLAVLAHPDDESLGLGGTLVKYATDGVQTHLVTATRGERGRYGTAEKSPGFKIVGAARTNELLAAARILGLQSVDFLDYMDGDLDQAPPLEASDKIAAHIREIRPQVVVTFGPEGAYGHPDHIAVSQFTISAIVRAASPDPKTGGLRPHTVQKLYWMAWPPDIWDAYQAAFKKLTITVDGVERQAMPQPDWSITTKVDATAHWKTVWEAVQCHQTQIAIYSKLRELSVRQHEVIWGHQMFYRAFSLVNSGRKIETDLFEGIIP
jgi:LmbE family N-acetylglucosaminyl deacetylase